MIRKVLGNESTTDEEKEVVALESGKGAAREEMMAEERQVRNTEKLEEF